jgi:glycosyltransferase involved in cell wall biosynthesis
VQQGGYFIGAPGGNGAVANHFTALGDELARRGHQVKLICAQREKEGCDQANNPAYLGWPSARPTRLADALFLARLILKHRPACLVANFGAVNWMCLVGSLLRVKHRIAFYHTLRGQIDTDYNSGVSPALSRGFRSFRKKLVYRTATAVVGISQAALRDAETSYGVPAKKCMLWRYSMPDPEPRLHPPPAGERENVVVCAGRLYPSKGQDVLISALGRRTSMANTRVEFFGSGPMLSRFQEMAQETGVANRCSFLGEVSNEEVLRRMSRARISIVPSRTEAFGLVNIESMSVGTPVIGSKVDGIPEIVRDGVDGYLVPPGDPEALAAKLDLLIGDADLRDRLGRNARQRFMETYENSSVVGKQVEWLDQLTGRENGKGNGKG